MSAKDKLSDFWVFLSEASNIGIVLKVIAPWFGGLMRAGAKIFPEIAYIADFLIYVFKIINRFYRWMMRFFFKHEFHDEIRVHPHQVKFDLLIIVFFTLATLSLAGVLIAGPTAPLAGWAFGLVGQMLVGYVEYYTQARFAKEEYNREPTDEKQQLYQQKQRECYGFMALLFGLSVLLLSSSALTIAPAALIPVLIIAYKLGSAFLIGTAVYRFGNFIWPKVASCHERCGLFAPKNTKNEQNNHSCEQTATLTV
jgi:hypothetical protein